MTLAPLLTGSAALAAEVRARIAAVDAELMRNSTARHATGASERFAISTK
jgi:hypothetical protein